ncbi:phosphoglycolate phosphatase [Pedobacter sp. ok626]|uniref:HAD family hydrolase n=1 Tax=Pedobacter sp. ok626 TaxID=1761882 RepID=UPI0008829BA5|nr:HAD family hydrolase [Pedobacter sp. ok626]SDJ56756.1 phosphoglycolate phosphatase [Pedobacter sp. ok626]
MNILDWKNLKAIILDVDGTLYHQSKLRKKMLFLLLKHYLLHPWQIKDLFVLYHFRKEREKIAGQQFEKLEEAQYRICAEQLNLPEEKVKKVITKWILQEPNQYLAAYRYPGLLPFINLMNKEGFKIVIYSDYPAVEKLKAMRLPADLVVAATDPEVSALKPNPKGLNFILNTLNYTASNCLFIGDREELDGQSALKLGMPFLLISKKRKDANQFYNQLIENYTKYKLNK